MKVRSIKVGIAVLALALLSAMAAPAMAADSVTVNAEVDVDPYSIVLDDGATLDYGMLEPGDWGWPVLPTEILVRNNGGSAVRLDMVGTDASNGSGGVWELDPMSVGADQFSWTISGPFGGTTVNDDSSSQLMGGMGLLSGDSVWFDSQVYMPSSTSGYGTYHWSGTIYASAP